MAWDSCQHLSGKAGYLPEPNHRPWQEMAITWHAKLVRAAVLPASHLGVGTEGSGHGWVAKTALGCACFPVYSAPNTLISWDDHQRGYTNVLCSILPWLIIFSKEEAYTHMQISNHKSLSQNEPSIVFQNTNSPHPQTELQDLCILLCAGTGHHT